MGEHGAGGQGRQGAARGTRQETEGGSARRIPSSSQRPRPLAQDVFIPVPPRFLQPPPLQPPRRTLRVSSAICRYGSDSILKGAGTVGLYCWRLACCPLSKFMWRRSKSGTPARTGADVGGVRSRQGGCGCQSAAIHRLLPAHAEEWVEGGGGSLSVMRGLRVSSTSSSAWILSASAAFRARSFSLCSCMRGGSLDLAAERIASRATRSRRVASRICIISHRGSDIERGTS